jgi:hypothetical protein
MRAKTINETNFERNNDIKSSVGVGKVKEAKEILEELFNGGSRRAQTVKQYDIRVKSLDNIEVTYSKTLIDRYQDDLAENLKKYFWTLKYHPITQFDIEDYYKEGTFMNHITRDNDWNINRFEQSGSSPEKMDIKKSYVCSIAKDKKDSKEIAEAMVEGLNQKYGKLWVFETIDSYKSKKSSQ